MFKRILTIQGLNSLDVICMKLEVRIISLVVGRHQSIWDVGVAKTKSMAKFMSWEWNENGNEIKKNKQKFKN